MTSAHFRGRRVVVTGGGGFIGRAVCRQVLEAGARHVRSVQASPGGTPEGVEEIVADLRDPSVGDATLEGAQDVVHLAAQSGGIQLQHGGHAELLSENLAMTRSVLSGAVKRGVERAFVASSAVIYEAAQTGPLSEDAPLLTPGHPAATGYAWSKLTDEAMSSWAAAEGLHVVIGRFSNVYGPGATFDPERSTVVHALIAKALNEPAGGMLRVWGREDTVRSFLYVEDAARAVLTILEGGGYGAVYNIDAEQPVTMRQLADAVMRATGRELEISFEPARPGGPMHRVLATDRLRQLGFSCQTSLDAGLLETSLHYHERGRR